MVRMRFALTTAPAAEPVSSAEFVAWTKLDSDAATADASLITALLKSAREHLERFTGPMIAQTWEGYLDEWPSGDVLAIGKLRVSAIASVKYTDEDDAEETLSSADYRTDFISPYARIILKDGVSWPSVTLRNINPIKITFTAGYTNAAAVPADLKHAITLLAAHWYANREPVTTGGITELPYGVQSLIANFRDWGF